MFQVHYVNLTLFKIVGMLYWNILRTFFFFEKKNSQVLLEHTFNYIFSQFRFSLHRFKERSNNVTLK